MAVHPADDKYNVIYSWHICKIQLHSWRATTVLPSFPTPRTDKQNDDFFHLLCLLLVDDPEELGRLVCWGPD